MLVYVERCTGTNHNGPAWIGRARVSRSGRTIYFNGMALKRATGGSGVGNHYDLRSREPYWVSGIKRDGRDRHWAGSGRVTIDRAVVDEYLAIVEADRLDDTRFVIGDIPDTDPALFHDVENAKL